MCTVLNIPRSTYYYESKEKDAKPDEFSSVIIKVFKENRRAYGTRRIKEALATQGKVVSRRRIARIKSENGLVSSYTVAKYKVHKTACNEAKVANVVNRSFNGCNDLEVVVSDLSYARVKGKWNYVCLMLDLFNREIFGFSAGPN